MVVRQQNSKAVMWTSNWWVMRPLLVLTVFGSVGLAACEGEPPPVVTVTDSAGVRITISSVRPIVYAEVDATPILSLGGPEDSGPTQFFRVQNIHVDPQGRLWVADGQSRELRIFESDGTHWKTRGGRGEGPGEFQRIRLIGSYSGDSVLVADDANGRVTVFDPEGEFIRTERLASGDGPLPRAFDVFPDGSVLGQVPRILATASLEDGQILGDSVRLVRVDFEKGTQQPQATALGPLWLWTGRSQIPIPFTINSGFDVHGESVHLVAGPAFRVRVFERGRLSEIYGVARDERDVTQDEIAAFRESTREYVAAARLSEYLAALDHPARPTVLPAYSGVIVASDGNAWVRLYSPDPLAPATWDIFSPEREWLGQAQTPAGFFAFSITGESLAGLWLDELGVEHVRVYEIRPG